MSIVIVSAPVPYPKLRSETGDTREWTFYLITDSLLTRKSIRFYLKKFFRINSKETHTSISEKMVSLGSF